MSTHTRICMACGNWTDVDLCCRCTQKLRVTRAEYEELERQRKYAAWCYEQEAKGKVAA